MGQGRVGSCLGQDTREPAAEAPLGRLWAQVTGRALHPGEAWKSISQSSQQLASQAPCTRRAWGLAGWKPQVSRWAPSVRMGD